MKKLEFFLYLVIDLVDVFLSVILFAMLARAIMSFLFMGEENKLSLFLFSITEPFIYPFRALFARLGWFQGMPLDPAFFFATVVLAMIQISLSYIPI